jgi:hypothetical protein
LVEYYFGKKYLIQTNENEIYIEKHVERGENENVKIENSKVEENGE